MYAPPKYRITVLLFIVSQLYCCVNEKVQDILTKSLSFAYFVYNIYKAGDFFEIWDWQ